MIFRLNRLHSFHSRLSRAATALILLSGLALLANQASAARPQPKTSASATTQRPNAQPGNSTYRQRSTRRLSRSQIASRNIKSTKAEIAALEVQLGLARNAERSVRNRHDALSGGPNPSSRLRNAVRQATLERANLENRISAANTTLSRHRRELTQAHQALNSQRRVRWADQTAAPRATRSGKAKGITFNPRTLGPTGSGNPQPTGQPKGILKSS